MAFGLYLGSMLVAFGPSAAFLLTIVSKSSKLVVVAISAAFAWLCSILVASLLWYSIPGFEDYLELVLIVSVLLQEAFRYGFVRLYMAAEVGIAKRINLERLPLSDWSSSLGSGVGFGLMYALVMYGGTIASALGPGDYFASSCPEVSLYAISAVSALFIQVLHVASMVIMFDALRQGSKPANIMGVVILHLAASLVTLFNVEGNIGGCKVSIPLLGAISIISVFAMLAVVRSPSYLSHQ